MQQGKRHSGERLQVLPSGAVRIFRSECDCRHVGGFFVCRPLAARGCDHSSSFGEWSAREEY